MNDDARYTPYHPRWIRPRMSTYWWLRRWPHLRFILREVSSVFVAWFVVYFLMLVHAVGQGEAAYAEFLAWSGRPLVLLLNAVSLLFVVFHAITWFNLAPQAIVMRARGRRVPGTIIAASNYAAWVVASAAIVWLLLR